MAKPATEFNNTQLKKAHRGLGQGRCRACVEAASALEVAERAAAQEKKMIDARSRVAAAERAYSNAKDAKNSGATAAERLAAITKTARCHSTAAHSAPAGPAWPRVRVRLTLGSRVRVRDPNPNPRP